jgi:dolichol-phosphate mannosyltransferase
MKKISVLIPCYNEEKGVGKVIKSVPKERLRKLGYNTEIIVIDNNSKDKTSKVALKAGAKVVFEGKQGKGNAVITGFNSIARNTDYVVMIDGDDTYRANEMLRLIEPLENGFSDVIIGTRLAGKIGEGSMTKFNRWGNWMFTFLVRTCYCGNVTDVCTGYFAWKREVVEDLKKHIESNGFSLEMEMIAKMSKLGYSIYSVPITYDDRAGVTNLHPVKDGARILHAWGRNLRWKPYADGRRLQFGKAGTARVR